MSEYIFGIYEALVNEETGEACIKPTVNGKLIRCRDCTFYTADERWCRRLGLCGAFDADGYCSHGERKETEDGHTN